MFGTLIGDLDGIYDPTDYNDRLLLGLKGAMSEAELHVLKQRMMAGKRAKAARGALGMPVPMGYVRRPSGEVAKSRMNRPRRSLSSSLTSLPVWARSTPCYAISCSIRSECHSACASVQTRAIGMAPAQSHDTEQSAASSHLRWRCHYGRRPTDAKRKQPGRPSTGRLVANQRHVRSCCPIASQPI